jgi:two-component system chemotaxis response regulator CheY
VKAIVIDDSKTIRMMLKKFLLAQGFETLYEAGDGKEALDKLREIGPVDLALVDWNMPVMDGRDFVLNLRQSESLGKIPVLMVTTESGQVAAAKQAGVNEFIGKPFNNDALRQKLDLMGFARPGA